MDLSGCEWGSFIIMIWLHVSQWPALTLLSSVWWLIETIRLHHAINSSAQTVQTTSGQAGDTTWPSSYSYLCYLGYLCYLHHKLVFFFKKSYWWVRRQWSPSQWWGSLTLVLVWASEQAKPNGFYLTKFELWWDREERYETTLCPDKTHWFWPCLFSIVYHLSKKDPVPC